MMVFSHYKRMIFILSWLLIAAFTWANESLTQDEARFIKQALKELLYIRKLVTEARYHSNNAKSTEGYDAFISNLNIIESQLQRHVHNPSHVPTQVPEFMAVVWSTTTPTESEKQYLVQANQELSYIRKLVEKARFYRNPSAQYVLNYDLLQQDIGRTQHDLTRYTHKHSRIPRTLPPLRKKENDK